MGLWLSKFCGMLLIAGALFHKVAQIEAIYRNRSAVGLNIYTVTTELLSTTMFMSYNCFKGFPFSAWGEPLFMAIQTFIIALEILFFDDQFFYAVCYFVAYILVLVTLLSGCLGDYVMSALQGLNVLMLLSAKVSQIMVNYQNGHMGVQSFLVPCFALVGSMIRLFTSIQETRDTLTRVSNVASAIVSLILFCQLIVYWDSNPRTLEEEEKLLKRNQV